MLGVQKEAVLAAKRSVVTVEEIVDDFGRRAASTRWCCRTGPSATSSEVPGGAFPSYAQGYYPRNNAFYKEWDAISRERDCFLAWMKTNVLDERPRGFRRARAQARAAAE